MKKNSFYTCFSKIITIFAAIKNKIGGKIIAQAKKFFHYFFTCGFVHSWIIPILHAVLWATGLLFAQLAKDIFNEASHEDLEVIQFLAIFLILFLEVLIVMFDIYVVQKANYLTPRFIIFMAIIFIAMVGTTISGGLAFTPYTNISKMLIYVLVFSSTLKLIENLLMNNPHWYIVRIPDIFDARGTYISRQLS